MNDHSIQDLLDILKPYTKDTLVRFDFCNLVPDVTPLTEDNNTYWGGVQSYRGFYEHLALDYTEGYGVLASDLCDLLTSAIGKTFMGYKGGHFTMSTDTPLWVAQWGHSTGTFVRDATRYFDGDLIILNTAHEVA